MFKRKEGDDEDDDFSCAEDSSHQIDKGEREQLGQQLAHKGHNVVKGLRVGLFASLLLATVLASVSIFLYTRDQEELAFEDAFADNSLKIVEAFKTTAERRLSAVASFGTTITSYTLAVNATWPFVTVPQFEARSSHILNLAEAIAIAFAPLVYPKDRETWENDYVPSNIGWIEESFQYQENVLKGASEGTSAINDAAVVDEEASSNNGNAPPPTYEGMPDFSAGYSKQIFTTGFTPLGELGPLISEGDVFLPWWQRAPSSRSEGAGFINIDLVDDPSFGGDLVQVLKRRRAALGRMSFGGYTDDVNAPISGFYYPIIDGMDMYDPTANLVGATATLVYWDTYFANILPQNANGIIAVLSNTCNQTVTFQIDGPTVTVLGQGDLHDTKYDDFRQDVSFSSTINERSASRSYLGFPLDEEGCQYTLSVYASEEFEDIYVSSMPIIYMVGTVFIFFLTSGLFILYDRLVTNRQQAILRQAEQSGAIVSSLFPAMYRDRLIKAHEDVLERRNGPRDNGKNIKTFANQALDDSGKTIDNDEPIADLYSDCTVLFADVRARATLPYRPYLFLCTHRPTSSTHDRLRDSQPGVLPMIQARYLHYSKRSLPHLIPLQRREKFSRCVPFFYMLYDLLLYVSNYWLTNTLGRNDVSKK